MIKKLFRMIVLVGLVAVALYTLEKNLIKSLRTTTVETTQTAEANKLYDDDGKGVVIIRYQRRNGAEDFRKALHQWKTDFPERWQRAIGIDSRGAEWGFTTILYKTPSSS